MIDALISGKLIRDCELKQSGKGTAYCRFLLSVATGDGESTIVSGVAFKDVAEKVCRLKKGDPLAVVGSLRQSTWEDKASGETKHGLDITVANVLSVFDIKKRRAKPENTSDTANSGDGADYTKLYGEYNDPVPF